MYWMEGQTNYLDLILSFTKEGDISYLKRIGSYDICFCQREYLGKVLLCKIWLLYDGGHIDKDAAIELLDEANRISPTVFPTECNVPYWFYRPHFFTRKTLVFTSTGRRLWV
jgi:hypothetical protein